MTANLKKITLKNNFKKAILKKAILLIYILQISFFGQAQQPAYKKLDLLSSDISKIQLKANDLSYEDNATNCQVSFSEVNFKVNFYNLLATNAVYKKSIGKEVLYLTENIDLSKVNGITAAPISKDLMMVELHFKSGARIEPQLIENGKVLNKLSENSLPFYCKNNDSWNTLFARLFELCTNIQISKGLTTEKAVEEERKDWTKISLAAFRKKHPLSLLTMQADLQLKTEEAEKLEKDTYERERVTAFMDSLSDVYKLRIGMSEEAYKQRNPELVPILFTKKNTYDTDGGDYRSFRGGKKYYAIDQMVFKKGKLNSFIYKQVCANQSDRLLLFSKYRELVKANVAEKFMVKTGSKAIGFYHPTEKYRFTITNDPTLDPYTDGRIVLYIYITALE